MFSSEPGTGALHLPLTQSTKFQHAGVSHPASSWRRGVRGGCHLGSVGEGSKGLPRLLAGARKRLCRPEPPGVRWCTQRGTSSAGRPCPSAHALAGPPRVARQTARGGKGFASPLSALRAQRALADSDCAFAEMQRQCAERCSGWAHCACGYPHTVARGSGARCALSGEAGEGAF